MKSEAEHPLIAEEQLWTLFGEIALVQLRFYQDLLTNFPRVQIDEVLSKWEQQGRQVASLMQLTPMESVFFSLGFANIIASQAVSDLQKKFEECSGEPAQIVFRQGVYPVVAQIRESSERLDSALALLPNVDPNVDRLQLASWYGAVSTSAASVAMTMYHMDISSTPVKEAMATGTRKIAQSRFQSPVLDKFWATVKP